MRDPAEGVTAAGIIVTSAARDRVPAAFEPVLTRASDAVAAVGRSASLYLYGSVATGQARLGRSDVDLLTIGVDRQTAKRISAELSGDFRDVCRAVEIAAVRRGDFDRSGDDAYGNRVFLRHYCVHVAGPVHPVVPAGFPADARAARGFNGDMAEHVRRWRAELDTGTGVTSDLARRVARKTLLAVAGLVSVHDRTWTTDRATAASRWGQIEPGHATGVDLLLEWTDVPDAVHASAVRRALDDTVQPIVATFASTIGPWS